MCKECQCIYLIGIGMGGKVNLTLEAEELLHSCDCIIGAKRMTESLERYKKTTFTAYQPEEIHDFIKGHTEYKKIAVALSGDAGFYSGAKKLEAELEGYEVKRVPGISSVVYLAAKLQESWEDAALVSVHGRKQNYIYAMDTHEKTFLLLGSKCCGEELCDKIRYYGLGELDCWIGRRLSYEDEAIIHKKGDKLQPEDCSGLDVAFIRNTLYEKQVCRHIQDDEYIRGKVPMTKAEIRAISLAKLGLTADAIVYDIGAGTGSISVEAAIQSGNIKVYAVEKNPEAVNLIRENKRKFKCDWLDVVEGSALEVIGNLEPPTHVFIGGSSGDLKEILRMVKAKNPQVRIVLTAISLETVKEAMEAMEEGILTEPQIVQIAASKSKKLGRYHMMTGMNPVYIITDGEE